MPPSIEEVRLQIEEDTFQATIINNSPFTVSIDEKTIQKGEKIKSSFPLRKTPLYDGSTINYTIPLSCDVYYLHKEKVQITNNQATVVIEPPSKNNIREAYIVVKNTSKQTMRFTNGARINFPCCLGGRANTQYAKKEHNIAPSKIAVYEILQSSEEMKRIRLFVFQNDKHYSLLENTSLQHGYIYTYEFNGKEVIKTDERPILKIGEPLWKMEDASIAIEKVLRYENLYYAIGKKKLVDSYENSYYCPYVICMDNNNNIEWKKEGDFDGEINDAVLLEDGRLLTCGQSVVAGENVGSLWLYGSDGTLLSSKNYTHLEELINLAITDDGVVIVGLDNEGKCELSKITILKNAISTYKKIIISFPSNIRKDKYAVFLLYDDASKTLFLFFNLVNENGEVLPSKLFAIKKDGKTEEINIAYKIASISSAMISSEGVIYVGGESAINKKEAVIIKIEKDKTSKVFYQGSSAFSYITSLHLNEAAYELIIGGVCKGKESSGLGGVPFFASFDTKTGKELWRREYKGIKQQILRSFVPCLDYGFIASFSSFMEEDDNIFYGASLLARMSATGDIK